MAKQRNKQNSLDQLYGGEFPPAVEAIQRSSLRILKDICYGNIRFETQGRCFLDENLLTALHYTASTRRDSTRLIKMAMDFFIFSENFQHMEPNTKNIYVATQVRQTERWNILSILTDAIMVVISNGGRDITPLAMVQMQIQKCRQSISDI